MSEQIFEYKSDQDWFVGKWEAFNYFTCFGGDKQYEEGQEILRSLLRALDVEGLQLHVIRLHSVFQLISFVLEMVTAQTGRTFDLRQHAGALLVTEGDKLVYVQLPRDGVQTDEFFGQASADFGDTILIATKNEGKTKEFEAFFDKLGYKVENLNQYPDLAEVAETGMTFEENARLKAETIARETGKMVLADDSGLKVDVLGGLPGVWSARFSGADATDARNNAKLLHELATVIDEKNRTAQFHCTLVVAAPGKDSLVVEADWPGYIAWQPKGENGFGYDPLFLVGETGKTAAEMTLEEKNKQSHRARALEKLVEEFPAWQAKK